jgi:hypothetical protein
MTTVAPERALKTYQPTREAVVVPEARKPSGWPLAALLLVLAWRLIGGWLTVAILAVTAVLVSLIFVTGNNDRVIYGVRPAVISELPQPAPLPAPVIPGN